MRDLRTGGGGLGAREASRKASTYGPNALPIARGQSWVSDVVHQLTHPLALLLWAAAGLALLLTGTPVLCWVIIAFIAVNAVVAFLQEWQAARAVGALAAYFPLQARVVRDNTVSAIAAVDLVPGDVLPVGEGDRVSADARLIDGTLEIDMSALTGESAPVSRAAGEVVAAVGLLVANVPEGLLPAITLALAAGVRVLAGNGALVKRLSAVETLGSTATSSRRAPTRWKPRYAPSPPSGESPRRSTS